MGKYLFLVFFAFYCAFSFSRSELNSYEKTGSHEVKANYNAGPGGSFSLFYPADLTPPLAVLTWGNGTGSPVGLYEDLLRHLASHGFVVIATHSVNTGSGKEMIEGVNWLLKENSNSQSIFYKKIDSNALGALGHSQGGGGTIRAGTDPRIKATAPLHPLRGPVESLTGPALFVTSSRDLVVPNGTVLRQYENTKVPAVFALLEGAGHMVISTDGGPSRGYVTAWFKWQLEGDEKASQAFTGDNCWLCADSHWQIKRNF